MKIIGVAYGDKPHSFLKAEYQNKKTVVLPKECEPFLKMETEIKFCHHCGGWCTVDFTNCPACHGSGMVAVLLPVVEEMALTE